MSDELKKDDFQDEEIYIQEESQEIFIGESQFLNKIFSVFPAFKNKNYQLYFGGQLISLIGTWLQMVAQGWLVLQITKSAYMLGIIAMLSNLPTFFLALFSGMIVDRFPKKHILYFTQLSSMILALVLGILTITKIVTVWEIGLLALFLGIVNALDSPARLSFVPEFVKKEELTSAIALNSGIFNAARVIGPGIAGFLIAIIGIGGAFILNGISYFAVIFALFLMKVDLFIPKKHLHILSAIREGISYSFNHKIIGTLLFFVSVSSVFGWSFTTILPFIASNTFHMGADGLGYLYSAIGVGAITAVVLVSALSHKIPKLFFILGGNFIFCVSLILFSLTSNLLVALVLLFFVGFGLLGQFSTINSTIQHLVTPEIRGRVMSIYTLMFIGFFPFGNFEIGFLSDKFGTGVAIQIGAIIVFICGFLIWFKRKDIS